MDAIYRRKSESHSKTQIDASTTLETTRRNPKRLASVTRSLLPLGDNLLLQGVDIPRIDAPDKQSKQNELKEAVRTGEKHLGTDAPIRRQSAPLDRPAHWNSVSTAIPKLKKKRKLMDSSLNQKTRPVTMNTIPKRPATLATVSFQPAWLKHTVSSEVEDVCQAPSIEVDPAGEGDYDNSTPVKRTHWERRVVELNICDRENQPLGNRSDLVPREICSPDASTLQQPHPHPNDSRSTWKPPCVSSPPPNALKHGRGSAGLLRGLLQKTCRLVERDEVRLQSLGASATGAGASASETLLLEEVRTRYSQCWLDGLIVAVIDDEVPFHVAVVRVNGSSEADASAAAFTHQLQDVSDATNDFVVQNIQRNVRAVPGSLWKAYFKPDTCRGTLSRLKPEMTLRFYGSYPIETSLTIIVNEYSTGIPNSYHISGLLICTQLCEPWSLHSNM